MRQTVFILLACGMMTVAGCGQPNDYDSHEGEHNDSIDTTEHRDTIQGRSGEPKDTGISHDQTGIGDTNLQKTPQEMKQK